MACWRWVRSPWAAVCAWLSLVSARARNCSLFFCSASADSSAKVAGQALALLLRPGPHVSPPIRLSSSSSEATTARAVSAAAAAAAPPAAARSTCGRRGLRVAPAAPRPSGPPPATPAVPHQVPHEPQRQPRHELR